MVQKEILVLAKSCKPKGYCVAGLEVVLDENTQEKHLGNWIRPVLPSANQAESSGSVPAELCANFSVLNIVTVNLSNSTPTEYQPENWIAPHFRANDVMSLNSLKPLSHVCDERPVWFDDKTLRDDQVRQSTVAKNCSTQSLMFIQPENLQFTLSNDERHGPKISVCFSYLDHTHKNLSVTDPAIKRLFKNQFPEQGGPTKSTSLFNADNYWLTLSLTPEYRGCRYVVVAAIVDHSGYINRNYG